MSRFFCSEEFFSLRQRNVHACVRGTAHAETADFVEHCRNVSSVGLVCKRHYRVVRPYYADVVVCLNKYCAIKPGSLTRAPTTISLSEAFVGMLPLAATNVVEYAFAYCVKLTPTNVLILLGLRLRHFGYNQLSEL